MQAINRVINLDFKSWSINESNASKTTFAPSADPTTYNSDYLKPKRPYVNTKPFHSKVQPLRVINSDNGELTSQNSVVGLTQAEAANANESYLKPPPGTYYKDAVIKPWTQAWAKEQMASSAGDLGVVNEPNINNDPSLINKLKYLILNDSTNADEYKGYVGEVQTIERYVANYPIKRAMSARLTAIYQLVTDRLRPGFISDIADIDEQPPLEPVVQGTTASKKKDDDVEEKDVKEEKESSVEVDLPQEIDMSFLGDLLKKVEKMNEKSSTKTRNDVISSLADSFKKAYSNVKKAIKTDSESKIKTAEDMVNKVIENTVKIEGKAKSEKDKRVIAETMEDMIKKIESEHVMAPIPEYNESESKSNSDSKSSNLTSTEEFKIDVKPERVLSMLKYAVVTRQARKRAKAKEGKLMEAEERQENDVIASTALGNAIFSNKTKNLTLDQVETLYDDAVQLDFLRLANNNMDINSATKKAGIPIAIWKQIIKLGEIKVPKDIRKQEIRIYDTNRPGFIQKMVKKNRKNKRIKFLAIASRDGIVDKDTEVTQIGDIYNHYKAYRENKRES